MSFADLKHQQQVVELLQRSLERGRLAHAYLFAGDKIDPLEAMARTLVKTLNCLQPRKGRAGVALDCCDRCPVCRRIDEALHPDIHWVRPESRSRVITIEQIRDLMEEVHLKPTEARFKGAVVVGADRMNAQAANAYLKTLEEPPPGSILVLLSTQPQRILETILSRCLRLNFAGDRRPVFEEADLAWLAGFTQVAAGEQKSLMNRYQLLGTLMARLAETRAGIQKALTARSPLERYEDADPDLREKWEDELTAAVEAEYRRQRTELLGGLHWWFRDVWLQTLAVPVDLLCFPQWKGAVETVASRVSTAEAMENLQVMEQTQRLLHSNIQEALALEVGLLKLRL